MLARLGRLAEAEPILRRLFLRCSGDRSRDPDLDQALAKCYIETFQLRAAEAVVRRWVADAPTDPQAHYWTADLKRRNTDVDPATLIAEYEHVLKLEDQHDQARIALAELYLKAHRNSDSEREYAIHLNRHPDDVEACLGMGQIAAEDGRTEEAIQFLDRAIKLAPRDYRPLVERARIESQRGRFAKSLEFFDKAVELDVVDPEVRYQRSLVLTKLGRIDDARKEQEVMVRLRKDKENLDHLLEGLRKSPKDTELQHQAARWFFDHGHPEEGLRWAEKILRENSRHVETNRLLADHYEKQGKHGLANFYRMQAGEH